MGNQFPAHLRPCTRYRADSYGEVTDPYFFCCGRGSDAGGTMFFIRR